VELVAEGLDDLLALVLAHEAVVDEDAGQLLADRLVDQQRRDARVHAARQAADDLPVADLLADRATCSSTMLAADQVMSPSHTSRRKVLRTSCPYGCGRPRVELDAVELAVGRLDGRDRRLRRRRRAR
jgi:hypothetical protein